MVFVYVEVVFVEVTVKTVPLELLKMKVQKLAIGHKLRLSVITD